eukprot:CAMPEP_0177673782 /NCGR_PEP_ID=MMETSP0447-20121125/26155_1 /TAXON_ID=0 /ORGANISM="Stygamoeba regulata, Strain BSH-02190019" /LENGTH=47 /DNA_ID= /DNA_START= /DNA_END= /DNA_ORIENTATION=
MTECMQDAQDRIQQMTVGQLESAVAVVQWASAVRLKSNGGDSRQTQW